MDFKIFGENTLTALLEKLKIAFDSKTDKSTFESFQETTNEALDKKADKKENDKYNVQLAEAQPTYIGSHTKYVQDSTFPHSININNKFIYIGNDSHTLSTTDGENWDLQQSKDNSDYPREVICYNPQKDKIISFDFQNDSGVFSGIYGYSEDGINWTKCYMPLIRTDSGGEISKYEIYAVQWYIDKFVASAFSNEEKQYVLISTTDGENWERIGYVPSQNINPSKFFYDDGYKNALFFTDSSNGTITIYHSYNGLNNWKNTKLTVTGLDSNNDYVVTKFFITPFYGEYVLHVYSKSQNKAFACKWGGDWEEEWYIRTIESWIATTPHMQLFQDYVTVIENTTETEIKTAYTQDGVAWYSGTSLKSSGKVGTTSYTDDNYIPAYNTFECIDGKILIAYTSLITRPEQKINNDYYFAFSRDGKEWTSNIKINIPNFTIVGFTYLNNKFILLGRLQDYYDVKYYYGISEDGINWKLNIDIVKALQYPDATDITYDILKCLTDTEISENNGKAITSGAVAVALNNKQDKITGTVGQVVGFDEDGNPIAETITAGSIGAITSSDFESFKSEINSTIEGLEASAIELSNDTPSTIESMRNTPTAGSAGVSTKASRADHTHPINPALAMANGYNASDVWNHLSMGIAAQGIMVASSIADIRTNVQNLPKQYYIGNNVSPIDHANFRAYGFSALPYETFVTMWNENKTSEQDWQKEWEKDPSGRTFETYVVYNISDDAFIFTNTTLGKIFIVTVNSGKWSKLIEIGSVSKDDIEALNTKLAQKVDGSDLNIVALTGNYGDLSNTPEISTNISTDSDSEEKIASPKAVYDFVNNKVSSVYKPAGTKTLATLPTPTATELGNVYNMSEEFTTTVSFVEGTGHNYPAGTNVVCIDNGNEDYLWDVLSGIVDLSNYAEITDLIEITSNDVEEEWAKIFD